MKKKILYVVNIDSFFISHREDIALKAKSFLKIHLATKFKRNVNYFKKKKFIHIIYSLREVNLAFFQI